MDLGFARSASRHGISRERAAYVIEQCALPIYANGDAGPLGSVIFLGPDRHGVPLEIGAIDLGKGKLLVIHAMPLRRTYFRDYEEVMRWHAR